MGIYLNDINVKYFEMVIPPSERGHRKNQDYNARCPICGDSRKNKSLKRFHLYTKSSIDGDLLKCFNGDCDYTGNMYSFLKEFHPALYQSYVQEMNGKKINHIQEFLKNEKEISLKDAISNIDILKIDENRPKELFDVPDIFIPIQEGSYADKYLKSRNIDKELYKYYLEVTGDGLYKDGDKEKDLSGFVIIPLYYGDKLYGFSSRNTKRKEFYIRIPEANSGLKIWNFFNVNLEEPLYIFEAVFDAQSIKSTNVVACLGADFPQERLKQVKDPIFIFDNDKTGRERADKYAKKGYKVLIWDSKIKIKDLNTMLTLGATKESLQKFVDKNIYQGLSAQVRLKMN